MSGATSGGSKKHGRNNISCKVYRDSGRREKNKRLKIARHLKLHPKDKQSAKALAAA